MKEKLDRLIALLEERKRLGIIDEGGTIYLTDLKASRLAEYGELEPLVLPSITFEANSARSNLQIIPNFLSPNQCQMIIDYAKDILQPSSVITDEPIVNNQYRTSSEVGLSESHDHPDQLNVIINNIKSNIAAYTGYPIDHQEKFAIIRYKQNEEYKPHHDYFSDAAAEVEQILRNGGERVMTFLMCLQPPIEGGETEFPLLQTKIKQEQGQAVYWRNADLEVKELYEETRHAGLPVLEGEKWMMTCWIRQTPIATL